MVSLKCRSCGDMIPVENNQTFVVCESCGNRYDVPLDEKKEQFLNLYSRADDAWDHKDFEEASELYQQILNQDNSQSEAHFGLVLCKYGITYENDPATGKKMPNCNRINRDSILDDKHYQAALKYASPEAAANFKARAQAIDRISRDFLKIVDKEPPYDVFISYKRTDESGNITQDSKVARKLYYHLTEKGFKVFFAEVTLNNMAGEKYEPYIFAALSSAPVMVLLGSKRDHFDATWVKNEWRRYLVLMSQGLKKTLIPAYYDMDPYHLPGELRNLQAVNAAEITFQEDLTEIIRKKVADAREGVEAAGTSETKTVSLKDKYATKDKIEAVVKATDCERDTAINVLIQNYGDVKKTIVFIEGDPDYKKALWHCTECGTANTHDVCRQCGVTKKESIEVARERAKAKEKAERESAAYKYAQKQKAKKTVKTIIIIGVILAVLIGLYALGKQMAAMDTEALTSVAIVIGFIIGIILFFLLGAPGGIIGFGVTVGICAAVICGIFLGFRALFIKNVDDLYTPEIQQTYVGTYDNGDAFVTITECDAAGNVTGNFAFISEGTYGQYGLSGYITSKKSNGDVKLTLSPTEWIVQPPNFTFLDPLEVKISKNYTKFEAQYSMTLYSGEESGSSDRTLKTAADLQKLVGGSGTYFLGEDIDLTGTEWTPISEFAGTLVGNGHTITGLTLKADSNDVGFFSVLKGAVVNVNFAEANVEITGRRENIGILCGKMESGSISQVSVQGTVNAKTCSNVGGIVGKVEVDGGFALANLNSEATVNGLNNVGGIVGSMDKEVGSANSATLSKLRNTGSVTADGDYAGGIVGYANMWSGYSSEYTLLFTGLENTGSVVGGAYVGGIAGYAGTDSKASAMQDCTNSSSVEGECFVGCIAGKLTSVSINNCKNDGSTLNATGHFTENGEKYAYVGGFVGYGYVANNCTNTVSISYADTGAYVGGIFGFTDASDNLTMTGLANNADISGYSHVGGVIGGFAGENGSSRTIELSLFKNTGAVTGQKSYTGGIIGYLKQDGSYSASITVKVSECGNTGNVTGAGYVGGIFGSAETDSGESTIQDCSNSSAISGEYYVGCIAGQALNMVVNYCTNTGSTLTATGSITVEGNKYACVGGFVGRGYLVNNCTNEVEINYTGGGLGVGGIIGYVRMEGVSNHTMTNLKNNASVTGSNYVGGIFGHMESSGGSSYTVEYTEFENTASVKGNKYVGGIIGYLKQDASYSSSATLYASDIKSTGSVSGNSTIGGIFGYAYTDSDKSTISDYSTSGSFGNVEGITKS